MAMNTSQYSQNNLRFYNKNKRSTTIGIFKGLNNNNLGK